jgi:hypothetical protein
VTLVEVQSAVDSPAKATTTTERIDVGILTKGKPTLGMALTSLLLQEDVQLRIHIVDTAARPVISRDDVRFALRLASDRHVQCSYEYSGESDLAFSTGKARLVSILDGSHLCFLDDDVVVPSRALRRLLDAVQERGTYGYVSPLCTNSMSSTSFSATRRRVSPGSLIYQDALVRRILLEYYETTVDVLDRRRSNQKVWETAFLTALFDELNRASVLQPEVVIYHLDYQEPAHCIDEEATVVARSAALARELARKVRAQDSWPAESPRLRRRSADEPRPPRRRWARRALRMLSWVR